MATASETSASAANFAEEDVDRVPVLPFGLLFDCRPEKEEVMALLESVFYEAVTGYEVSS